MAFLPKIAALAVFLIVCQYAKNVESANVLGVFSTFGRSHFIIYEALMKGLAAKGHNVSNSVDALRLISA